MHLGAHDVSRTIDRKTASQFHTSLLSTLTIPREMGTQEEYCVSNGGDIHLRINTTSTTINRQTGSGFCVNQHSTLANPRETSTQGDYQLSDGGAMHMGTDDGSRSINVQTCSASPTGVHTVTCVIFSFQGKQVLKQIVMLQMEIPCTKVFAMFLESSMDKLAP
ncbi:hypothetical protein GIB67_041559 [Kingdonia uniflora]|uniref:Uncharacterized protein n=1 Tax=Kingdonia uniflora TaxID=39325 RepID=A0A7J7MQU6_9MAGN|nr:hypothetical protein GIB67_041559 [Kingdonia uniflora]